MKLDASEGNVLKGARDNLPSGMFYVAGLDDGILTYDSANVVVHPFISTLIED